jgi:hypothetical protein
MTPEHSPGTTSVAATLLQNIDRVARWLPVLEPLRSEVLTAVADIGHRFATDTLSSGVIEDFRANLGRLRSSPLRTLLLRRTSELSALCSTAAGRLGH